jgi:ribose-phosphate pyrophosphokinase
MMRHRSSNRLALFSLLSGHDLVHRIGLELGVAPGHHEERDFDDGEHKIRPLESVRGCDVYVVQSLFGDDKHSVNDKLIRILFFLATLRDAGAESVTLITPYLCYARKDMRTKARDPVSHRYVATLLEAVGVDRVVALDVHNLAAFHNAFRIPTEHLTAAPLLVEAFAPLIGDRQVAVVSPDSGGVKRAERFRTALERRLERPVGAVFVEKFRSQGVVHGGAVVGDVENHVAIVLDDIISGGTTMSRAAAACLDHGARTVYGAATHGVFAKDAERVLDDGWLEGLVIVDTIPPNKRILSSRLIERIMVVDCAPLLANAILQLYRSGSIVDLFEPSPTTRTDVKLTWRYGRVGSPGG